MSAHSVETCLKGEAIYGDDFTEPEREAWFRDEQEAYYAISRGAEHAHAPRSYGYHALNRKYGYAHLPPGRFDKILSLGGAFGDELLPIIDRIDSVAIVEPAEGFASSDIQGVPVAYVAPQASGLLPFADDTFSLATCFGTLHHVCNVSSVVRELARCLKPGSLALIREPIISMGDWRKPRPMLTKRERGIPLPLFDRVLTQAGFEIVRRRTCMFAMTNQLNMRRGDVYDSALLVAIDGILCQLTQWHWRYHRETFLQKLTPTSVFYAVRKRGAACAS